MITTLAVEALGLRDYPIECAFYWLFMSVVHGAFFAAGVLVITVSGLFSRDAFGLRVRRWALFNLCLFIAAGLANGLWSCLIFHRLYWSTDYLFDFSPFWPITQGTIDARFGDQVGALYGITLLQLQIVWFLFAAAAWIGAGGLYRLWRKFRAKRIANRVSADRATM